MLKTLLLILSAASTSLTQTSIGSNLALMLVIVLTGVAMGIRNGTVRRLAILDHTTNVLTSTISGWPWSRALRAATMHAGHAGPVRLPACFWARPAALCCCVTRCARCWQPQPHSAEPVPQCNCYAARLSTKPR
ncbi:hypothetical protein FTO74_15955 [Granulicella sp. WH15]|nr:hypothetical protein [Granulicella sp. WH15]QHN04684.1 hypothetical protein FTO74_15955 [Granulicella sp. WH15]